MVKIITDSAADFEPWELEKQDITCIPLTVMFGDREYQENVNLSKEQFYDLLAREEGAPKTAQASPAVVGELFQQARQKGLQDRRRIACTPCEVLPPGRAPWPSSDSSRPCRGPLP